jgi:hypothetical protein
MRNCNQIGSCTFTLRGGAVLYGRMLMNTMTMDEVAAAFYLWGPGAYKKIVQNTSVGMRTKDYERGGRAARLNRSADSGFALSDFRAEKSGKPYDAVSFHSRASAERNRVRRQFALDGHPNPAQAADDYLKNEARRWLFENPVRHVLMSIPFAWRGVWCFYGGKLLTVLNALCAVAFMALAAYGLFARNTAIAAFIVTPFCMLLFNALATHNLSRYSAPAIPFLILSLLIAVYMLAGGRSAGR